MLIRAVYTEFCTLYMLLQLKGIQKRFGGVVALRNGNLSVNAGEVHLLMGENGAGKSTLMKIVAGMFPPMPARSSGTASRSPSRPRRRRRRTASRWFIRNACWRSTCPLRRTSSSGRQPRMRAGTRESPQHGAARPRGSSKQHNFPLQANWIVQNLSPAQKQLVEICRAIQQVPVC